MTTVFVQFSDSGKQKIISAFGCKQDSLGAENNGSVDTGDLLWKTYYDLFPPEMQAGMPAPTPD